MKYAYLFDIDLIERKKYPTFPKLPNHCLMKLSDYYKKKGYKVRLIYLPKYIPKKYDNKNVYIGSALYSGNLVQFKKRLKLNQNMIPFEKIKIGTPLDNCQEAEIPGIKCDYTEYDKMIKRDNIKLQWYPANVGFLTRGCIRHCQFCVNRNRNKITEVNTLDEIYQKEGQLIYLLDDNLFESPNAEKHFNEIAEFGRKHENIKISLQNGIDARNVTPEKLKALGEASKYISSSLHVAWDDVKNSFIFKNIMEIKKYSHIGVKCYCLLGENIYSNEDFKKDILGFMYRYLNLMKIGVLPINQLYEDDREEFKNKYWNLYKFFLKNYTFMKVSKMQTIYRKIPPNQKPVADKIVEMLEEFEWVITTPVGKIVEDENFDLKMKSIADYIGIKHYSAN